MTVYKRTSPGGTGGAGVGGTVVRQASAPTDTSVLWVDTDDNTGGSTAPTVFFKPVNLWRTTNIDLTATVTTIDSVTLTNGMRVLLSAQTTGAENGIYTWSSTTSMLTRATDWAAAAVIPAYSYIPVMQGTANGNKIARLNAETTVGTTAATFTDAILTTGPEQTIAGRKTLTGRVHTSGGLETTEIYSSSQGRALTIAASFGTVNWVVVTGSAANVAPQVEAAGGSTNLDLALKSKGTGRITFNGLQAPWTTPPASATANGIAGQIAYDSGFFYVCTATNTWVRTALATW